MHTATTIGYPHSEYISLDQHPDRSTYRNRAHACAFF